MPFSKGVRLFHTLRHLKPVQLYGRVLFRIRKPRLDARSAPAIRTTTAPWQTCLWRTQSMSSPATFTFLNVTNSLERAEDWNNPHWEKLWLYNLHYFDDLNAVGCEQRVDWHTALIERWVEDNRPAVGNGWEPYTLSLRIVNWIKWSLRGNTLNGRALDSLAHQVRILAQRLEWHLLGNHLFANAKALVFAGLYFEGSEAEQWLRTGLSILDREVAEQVLPDGGHFELSPMYHAIILEDILDLINGAQAFVLQHADQPRLQQSCDTWRNAAAKMLPWLSAMTHPDGQIALLNDAAHGIAPDNDTMQRYADALGVDVNKNAISQEPSGVTLSESGYVRADNEVAVLIADVGDIGPQYLPGHAHADTLSFELSVFNDRFIVDSGTSMYGVSDERLRQRSTRAHNTVEINGRNSSDVWSGFRVGRRARPFDLSVDLSDPDTATIACAHDGYKHLAGAPVHAREWVLRRGSLCVRDDVSGRFESACVRYTFHPNVTVSLDDSATSGTIEHTHGKKISLSLTGGNAFMRRSTYHPRFGVHQACVCLEIAFNESRVLTNFCWH